MSITVFKNFYLLDLLWDHVIDAIWTVHGFRWDLPKPEGVASVEMLARWCGVIHLRSDTSVEGRLAS